MIKLFACLSITGLLLVQTGCRNESPKGGPGATATANAGNRGAVTGTANRASTDPAENTFTLKVPSGSTDVDRGKNKDVTISLDRGDTFNQDVKLSFKLPAGLKVTPADPVIKAGTSEIKVLIEAATDAPTGEKTIEVTGTPTSGKPTTVTMVVKVEQRD